MYDPQSDVSPSSDSPAPWWHNRALILSASVAALGAIIAFSLCCVIVSLVLIPGFSRQMAAANAQPDLPPPPESPRIDDTQIPLGRVFLEEPFDEPSARWDQSLAQVIDGTYELRVDTANSNTYRTYAKLVYRTYTSTILMAGDLRC